MSSTDEFGNPLPSGDPFNPSDWEDEETKFFNRSNNMSRLVDEQDSVNQEDNSVDVDLGDDQDDDLPNVRPSALDVAKPLLGMAAVLGFYLVMWVH